MSAVLTFDDSLWPLVIFRCVGVMTNPQFDEFLARSESFLERDQPYVSITDMSQAGIPPLEQCRKLAEWLHTHEARLSERVLCNAILVTSAPLRLSMSLVFHLKKSMPRRAVSDMGEALQFAVDKLNEAGRPADAQRILHGFTTAGARVG